MTEPNARAAGATPACTAPGCFAPATDVLLDSLTGEVIHAVCTAHVRWIRPLLPADDELSVIGRVLVAVVTQRLRWRLSLARKKLPETVLDECARDVIAALRMPHNIEALRIFTREAEAA